MVFIKAGKMRSSSFQRAGVFLTPLLYRGIFVMTSIYSNVCALVRICISAVQIDVHVYTLPYTALRYYFENESKNVKNGDAFHNFIERF